MPKFLVQATYTAEGAKGVIKDGGPPAARRSKNSLPRSAESWMRSTLRLATMTRF